LYALVLELTAEQYLWADMGVVLGFVVLLPTMLPKPFLQRGEGGREGGREGERGAGVPVLYLGGSVGGREGGREGRREVIQCGGS
jgi:hypothetical protein